MDKHFQKQRGIFITVNNEFEILNKVHILFTHLLSIEHWLHTLLLSRIYLVCYGKTQGISLEHPQEVALYHLFCLLFELLRPDFIINKWLDPEVSLHRHRNQLSHQLLILRMIFPVKSKKYTQNSIFQLLPLLNSKSIFTLNPIIPIICQSPNQLDKLILIIIIDAPTHLTILVLLDILIDVTQGIST